MFKDRLDAGEKLAPCLLRFKDENTVVLALPRGGTVPAAVVAKKLHAQLGLLLVRKLTHPSSSEYAIGAVAEDDEPIYNDKELQHLRDDEWPREAEAAARQLMSRRRALYYDDIEPPDVRGRTVIIIDDGIATGFTMEAAVRSVRKQQPTRVVVAVPVASPHTITALQGLVDEVIVLEDPNGFLGAVGAHYRHFPQVDDTRVKELLDEASRDFRSESTTDNATAVTLSTLPISFPATAKTIVELADTHNLDADIIDLLNQFPDDELFKTRADLETRFEDLRLLSEQKKEAPPERLNSPQY